MEIGGSPQQRIEALLVEKGWSESEFARRMDVKQQTVNSFMNGDSPFWKLMIPAARVLEVRPEWLQYGDLPKEIGSSAVSQAAPDLNLVDNFAFIPVYDVRAAAGDGAVNHDETPISHSAFRIDWLRRVTSSSIDHLAVISVAGDSMEPTLNSGDHVLIDRTVTRYTRDGLYVIRYAISDEMIVKRLRWEASSKTFTVKSDNPRIGDSPGVLPEDIQVVGRVLWLGRNIG